MSPVPARAGQDPFAGGPSGRRWMRLLAWATLFLAIAATTLVWASDVDTGLSNADLEAIAALGLGDTCGRLETFEEQLGCVRAVQERADALAPDYECVHEWGVTSHEPAAFLSRRRGCCYDRSRLIEKALAHHGLDVRHVAIFGADSWTGLVRPGLRSHSLSEVRTARGWMAVDSIRITVGRTANDAPVDTRELGRLLRDDPESLAASDYSAFLRGRFQVVYGLYSRHGGFYEPFIPLPDFDWAQLHHNF